MNENANVEKKEATEKECIVTRVGKWIDNKIANRKPISKGVKIGIGIGSLVAAGAAAYYGYTHMTDAGDVPALEEAPEGLADGVTEALPE